VHFRELLDRAEGAALLAQLHDRAGLRGADPGELGEQLRTGPVDVDREQIDRDDAFRRDRLLPDAGPRIVSPSDLRQRPEHDPERDEEQDVPLLARHGRRSRERGEVRPPGYRCGIPFP